MWPAVSAYEEQVEEETIYHMVSYLFTRDLYNNKRVCSLNWKLFVPNEQLC